MKLILDLVLIAIIALCAWSGYKKGIIMGIGGIVVILVSIYGANLLSNTFSHDVIPALRPFISGYTGTIINEEDTGVLAEMGWEDSTFSLDDLLSQNPEQRVVFAKNIYSRLGIFDDTAQGMAEEAVAYSEDKEVGMTDAVVETLCNRIVFVGGFLLFFLMLVIALTVAGNFLNFSYKLPAFEVANDIGGVILGVVTGILFCCVVGWLLHYTGLILSEEAVGGTLLARLFSNLTFLPAMVNG
jgi:hypothetical protein